MQLYNTLTRRKEELKTIKPNRVMIYACGPTVYNFIHIGNARPLVVFDVLRRYLSFRGFQVSFVQNFTDIDDKIIRRANEEQKSAAEIAESYIKEYHQDAEGLGILTPTVQPRVTQCMDVIIALISSLVEKGFAYQSGDDVYFRTKAFEQYGKLSHMPIEDLEAGSRVEVNHEKENPLDFAVWKGAKPTEPSWDSPWGKGRPGWHIECSAMATHFLAPTIDIHCGGQDLIFPHHENEIAQSECSTGVPFANYWLHNGYINIDNKKMSKSAGNFFTVREVANKYGYGAIRYLMLQAHYRSPINYNQEIMEQCVSSLQRLDNFRKNLPFALQTAPQREPREEILSLIDEKRQQFIEAMEDDCNTADALAAVFELVREMNPAIANVKTSCRDEIARAQEVFEQLTDVLGFCEKQGEDAVPQEVLDLFEKRKEARANKDFALADNLRDQIAALGFAVEETRQGSKLIRR